MDRIDAVWGLVLRHGDLDERSVASVAQVHRASRAVLARLLEAKDVGRDRSLGPYRMTQVFSQWARGYNPHHIYTLDHGRVRSYPQARGGLVPGTQILWDFSVPESDSEGCSHGCERETCWMLTLRDVVTGEDLPGALPVHNLCFFGVWPVACPARGSDGCVIIGGDTRVWRVERGGAAAAAAVDAQAWDLRELFNGKVTSPEDLASLVAATAAHVEGTWVHEPGRRVRLRDAVTYDPPLLGPKLPTDGQVEFFMKEFPLLSVVRSPAGTGGVEGARWFLRHHYSQVEVFGRVFGFCLGVGSMRLTVVDWDRRATLACVSCPLPDGYYAPQIESASVDGDGFPLLHICCIVGEGERRVNTVLSLRPDRMEPPSRISLRPDRMEPPSRMRRVWDRLVGLPRI